MSNSYHTRACTHHATSTPCSQYLPHTSGPNCMTPRPGHGQSSSCMPCTFGQTQHVTSLAPHRYGNSDRISHLCTTWSHSSRSFMSPAEPSHGAISLDVSCRVHDSYVAATPEGVSCRRHPGCSSSCTPCTFHHTHHVNDLAPQQYREARFTFSRSYSLLHLALLSNLQHPTPTTSNFSFHSFYLAFNAFTRHIVPRYFNHLVISKLHVFLALVMLCPPLHHSLAPHLG